MVFCFVWEKGLGIINYKNEKSGFRHWNRKSKRFQKECDNFTNTKGSLRKKFLASRRLCTRDTQRYSLFRVKGEKKSR